MTLPARKALSTALLAFCTVLACSHINAGEEKIKLKDDKSRTVVIAGCVTCHSLDYITMNAPIMDKAKWEKTVAKMIDVYKAPISKENAAAIVEYLSTYYGASE